MPVSSRGAYQRGREDAADAILALIPADQEEDE